MRRIQFIIMLVVLLLSVSQCTKSPNEPTTIRELTSLEKTIIESDNQFGLKIFKEIVKTQKDSNIFISPLSISMALGMTLNGANGTTREAMINTLELAGLSDQQINESYQSLMELLVGLDPKVKFQIANSIWYRNDHVFEELFFNQCKQYFDAEVAGLDFSNPQSKDIINAWVDENTNGKIKEIVKRINPNNVMFLINAIYFKGTWTYQFDESGTYDDQFYLPDNSTIPCKMMAQKEQYPYFGNDQFQAVDLPYGDGLYSMVIILPNLNVNIDDLIIKMDQSAWNEWLNKFEKQEGNIFLPRFKLEYKIKMNDVLKALGMGIAFSDVYADFTRMYKPGGLYIDEVNHKTFVEVNEEGTEAAAVTSVVISERSGGGPEGFVMHVNRPFIFAIREHHSGTILFVGKIVDPT
jgi:serine protease inhibitor